MYNIKNCKVIYNPISTSFNEDSLKDIERVNKYYGINTILLPSEYPGHLIELIKEHDDADSLILTLGGDGTVNEAYKAYNEIVQYGAYSHIPTGTTNDMAKNYNVIANNTVGILDNILNGEIVNLNSMKINGEACAYVSAFGYLSYIPYVTNSWMKKNMHHAGYVVRALPDLIKGPRKYNVTYDVDGVKGEEKCILGAITNSNGFGGVDIFPYANLEDNKIELLLLKSLSPALIASMFKDYLKNDIDLSRYGDHVLTLSGKNIELEFNKKYPNHYFDNDGEKSNVYVDNDHNTVVATLGKDVHVLRRKK